MAGSDDKKTALIPEAEVVANAGPTGPQAVMVTPAQLRKQTDRDSQIRQVISEYIAKNMVDGKDYGKIAIERNGRTFESKPSLFKPGAEKFCGLFKIRPTFKKDTETVDMLGSRAGVIAYICELVDAKGRVIGEGRGSSSVDPAGKDFDVNKAIKIAEKRAQIDAVLRTGGLSDFFTQDMEDAPKGESKARDNTTAPATEKQRALIKRKLDEQGVSTEQQSGYLIEVFGVEVPLTKEGASFVIDQMIGEGKPHEQY